MRSTKPEPGKNLATYNLKYYLIATWPKKIATIWKILPSRKKSISNKAVTSDKKKSDTLNNQNK